MALVGGSKSEGQRMVIFFYLQVHYVQGLIIMAALVMVLYVHIISFHVSVIMMQEFYNACVKNGM